MPNNYVPNADADFQNWQVNFITYCNANLAALGLVAGDMTSLVADQTDWKSKYQTHLDALAASQAATQGKKLSRSTFVTDIRHLVNKIQARPQTTDAQRAALRISMRDSTRTPVPPPSTAPLALVDTATRLQHTINFRDSSNPDRRGKPAGVTGAEIYFKVVPAGTPAPEDPTQYTYVAVDTATPFIKTFDAADAGKNACYMLRWINPSGEPGPWSVPAAATIAA